MNATLTLFRITCPHCGQKLRSKKTPPSGTRFPCPNCQGEVVYVPNPSIPPPSSAQFSELEQHIRSETSRSKNPRSSGTRARLNPENVILTLVMLLLFWTLSSGFGIGAGGVICAVILGVIKLARMAHQQREALMAEYQLWREDMTILRSGRADNQHWEEWIAKGQNLIRKLEGYGLGSKETYEERRRLAAHIRDDIRAYGAARVASAASLQHPPSITELARLRNNGLISADEFRAFSERLSTTPGERATDIIAAIERLYREHKKGAMTEGNYHAGLWALLDRLDRDARRRS